MDWDGLGRQLDAVSRAYAQRHGFRRSPEWLVLKIAEEAGELVQQFLAATGQGRARGKSPAELNDSLDCEIADLLGHTILLAHHRGTDLQAVLDRKWLRRNETSENPPSPLTALQHRGSVGTRPQGPPSQKPDPVPMSETTEWARGSAARNGDHADIQAATVLSTPTKNMLIECAGRLDGRGLIVLCGFPGSGKSSAARYLAARTGAMVLDKDAFAPRLESAVMAQLTGDPDDRDSDAYKAVVAPHIYDGLIGMATTAAARVPVVVDGPFLSFIRAAADARVQLADYVKARAGALESLPVITVWLDSPAEQIHTRMAARHAERDASKLANWPAYEAAVLNDGLREAAHASVDIIIRNY